MPELPITNAEVVAVVDLPRYLRDVLPVAEMAARCAKNLVVERGRRETAERMCKRMLDERNAAYDAHALGKLADELDEDNYASAAKALREAIFMLDKAAQKDAAWARLVRADGAAWLATQREEDPRPALDERDAAKQALRDLGADVDALLSD